MSQSSSHSADPTRGWVTLTLTFGFVVLFRLEQNVAYVLGISTRELVGLDVFPVGGVVQVLAPGLHADAGHLVSTLVWFIPFGYFLERRTRWEDYVGFVVLAGVFSTTLVPTLLVALGVSEGLGVGASGITYALVGREATARLVAAVKRRSLSRVEGAILAVAVLGLLLRLVSLVSESPAQTSVTGHATGLIIGVVTGVSERYVSITAE